jgi:hypothetical protein
MVRKLFAAGLVSAAAALIYRKPKAIAAANETLQEAASELLDGSAVAARATTKVARKVRRKAVNAIGTVTKPAASATQDASTAQENRNSEKVTLDTERSAFTNDQARTRKRRSDAGVKRGSRNARPLADAPIGIAPELSLPPVGLGEMETSAFAFGTKPPKSSGEAESMRPAAEEQVAEAHPS